ncbi:uncharacterized protein [Dysidea avara]|uniref:uncharacterized protein isoform X2 n=1 Tax=Dysidea avara TaxID=196820 RepID=UPI003316BFC4
MFLFNMIMFVALLLIPCLPDVEAVGEVIPGNEAYSFCNNRNLSFRSLIDALTNLSNDTVVTLSNHAALPSSVTLDHLNNITIIGQGAFLMMEIYLYKGTIKKVTRTCIPPKPDTTIDNNEIPMRDFVDSVIDDSSRRNAYICEIKDTEATHCRESFIEVMNEIED